MGLALFAVVFALLVAAIHRYLYLRWVRDFVAGSRGRKIGAFVVGGVGTSLAAALPLGSVLPDSAGPFISWPVFLWIGALGPLLSLLLVTEPIAWLTRRLVRAPVDERRRVLLRRTLTASATTVGAGLSGYGVFRAYAEPEVTELTLPIRGLPKALDGLCVVQLSDIHVGDFIEDRFMKELALRTQACKPDLLAITGDLVDGDVTTLGRAVARLAEVKSRYGSWFCTGNHEYYSGAAEWSFALERMGIGVLRNRREQIGDAGGSFDLVGVDDWREDYDLKRAVEGRDPERAAVLLAHQPKGFEGAAAAGIGLQLSGHTHAGQVFPGTLFASLGFEFNQGLFTRAGSHLYVSRGTGFWGPPMRLGSPPEIVKIILTPA